LLQGPLPAGAGERLSKANVGHQQSQPAVPQVGLSPRHRILRAGNLQLPCALPIHPLQPPGESQKLFFQPEWTQLDIGSQINGYGMSLASFSTKSRHHLPEGE
jgi:hypothetical protein